MSNISDIMTICLRDALILFPLVLGIGLLYSHFRVLDVSVDGIVILCGIVCICYGITQIPI